MDEDVKMFTDKFNDAVCDAYGIPKSFFKLEENKECVEVIPMERAEILNKITTNNLTEVERKKFEEALDKARDRIRNSYKYLSITTSFKEKVDTLSEIINRDLTGEDLYKIMFCKDEVDVGNYKELEEDETNE